MIDEKDAWLEDEHPIRKGLADGTLISVGSSAVEPLIAELDRLRSLEARALSAEAKLAQAVEARARRGERGMSAQVERDFAALLAKGWPERQQKSAPAIGGLTLLLACSQTRMAEQLVNSSVPESREFWRSRYPALASGKEKP